MSGLAKIIIPLLIAFFLISQSAYIIEEGTQALILQLGKPVKIIQEPGLYFKYPLIQDVTLFPKRVLVADARPAEYITLDKKRLTVDTVTRWAIQEPLVYYQTVRNEAGAISRLNDLIFARLRQEIGNHNFKEFIREEREFIMNQVTSGTAEAALRFGISVMDVRIKRVDLPEEVQASVFARMKAERERIAKRYRAEGEEQAREIRANANKEKEIILAEAYRQAETLRGQGDAESTAIYSEAYGRDEDFFSFSRRLDVYRRIFGPETSMILSTDNQLLEFLGSPTRRTNPASTPNTSAK
jgi:membrane protease subunit HflC